MSKLIYADNAATAPLSPYALEAMLPYLTTNYGNPSSIYSVGRAAKKAIENAREKVAKAIGALPEEIFFTAGGTESDNWAIKAAAELKKNKGMHIISTAIEHHAVLHTLQLLERQGYDVTYLGVDETGLPSLNALRRSIRSDTTLITVMAANNEIGTILPVADIGAIAREAGVLFHSDAVQAAGHIPLNVAEMNIDLLSLSGHKFGGPKGTGVLYIKKGVGLPSILQGGTQERHRRSGTENVAGIVGLSAALEQAVSDMETHMKRLSALRDRLIDGILRIPRTSLTGSPKHRLPGSASFVFEGVEGEALVLLLDQIGICASSGSACASGSLDPSHVLLALGYPEELAQGALRLTLGAENTARDVDSILEKLPPIITRLREMTPLWQP